MDMRNHAGTAVDHVLKADDTWAPTIGKRAEEAGAARSKRPKKVIGRVWEIGRVWSTRLSLTTINLN